MNLMNIFVSKQSFLDRTTTQQLDVSTLDSRLSTLDSRLVHDVICLERPFVRSGLYCVGTSPSTNRYSSCVEKINVLFADDFRIYIDDTKIYLGKSIRWDW
jgi:hypothetical protein